MGKTGGNSWLNVVKKAFRSPTKGTNKSSKRREEHEQEDDEQKKRGKRRWIFSKHCTSSMYQTTIQHKGTNNIAATANSSSLSNFNSRRTNNINSQAATDDTLNQKRAIEMAIAITTAAEAAVATVQAAVEVIHLARPSNIATNYYAAIVIQTAFRGYLARRALCALKGIVKLQALVRGHNVRQRARMTLRCVESLVRVQTQLGDRRRRLSYERSLVDSASAESRRHHLATRNSILSRERSSSITDESDSHQHTLEQIRAMLQKTKDDAASKREQALSYAFSHQMWRSRRDRCLGTEERGRWSDHEDITRKWKRKGMNSFDQRERIQNVDIDNAKSYSSDSAPTWHRSQNHYHNFVRQKHHIDFGSSPLWRANKNFCIHSHTTPNPSETRALQVHSASPRCLKEERKCMMAGTPKSRSNRRDGHEYAGAASMPNYMAATASTKARVQSQDAARHRPLTPERDKMVFAKKRLSFPDSDDAYSGFGMSDIELDHNLRSPSCQGTSDQGRLSDTFCFCEENL